jgi:ribosomal protein S6--L-glutamate ligase
VLTEWGRAVAKPLFGSLGLGIELLTDTMSSRRRIPELLQSFGAVYLQEYVPNTGRDIRAFVVGVEVAASIVRVAAPGQWRTNVHQGGTPEMCELDATMRTMAVGAAQAVGLDYTGVDLMEGPNGPCVLEVNGNPLWRGVLAATGRNMAEDIVARVATLAESGKARGGTHSG